VVGESGCGKSVTALSVMRLVANPPGKIVGGEINFNDENILGMNQDELTDLRGSKISMIFQDPMTSLNPVYTVGYQIAETVKRHRKDMSKTSPGNALLKCLTWCAFQIPNDVLRTIHTSLAEECASAS